MERYWMCGSAVLKLPQIAGSVFFRKVDGQCLSNQGMYIVLDTESV